MNHSIPNAIQSLIRVTDLQAPANEEEHDSMAQLLIEFCEPSHLGLSDA